MQKYKRKLLCLLKNKEMKNIGNCETRGARS